MAEKQLKIRVTTEGVEKSEQQARGLSASYQKVAATVASLVAAYYAAAKAVKFFSENAKMAGEQEEIFRNLETTVNLAGKSYDQVSKSIDRAFKSMQAFTEFGDTESAVVLTQLIQLSGNFEQSMKALPITLDMASSGFFNLDTAARYVGMALAGNVEMLGRYISELRAANSPQLAMMTAAEKTAFAMELLNKKFGGSAQENLKSYTKQMNQFNDYIDDIREALGSSLLPYLNKAAELLLKMTDAMGLTTKEYDTMIAKFSQKIGTETTDYLLKIAEGYKVAGAEMGTGLGQMRAKLLEYEKAEKDMHEATTSAAYLAAHKKWMIISFNGELTKNELEKQFAKQYDMWLEYQDKLNIVLDEIAARKPVIVQVELDLNMDDTSELSEADQADWDKFMNNVRKQNQEKIDNEKEYQEKLAELREQYADEGKDDLQLQLDTETEIWQEYYDNGIIGQEEFDAKILELTEQTEADRAAILERYAKYNETTTAREISSILDAYSGLLGGIGDFAEFLGAEAEDLKAIRIAEAIMNTYASAQLAVATIPPPAGEIIAATRMLEGFANVAAIAAVGFQFGTSGYEVPSGNPNDSYLFAAQSGEKISVTPAGKDSNTYNSEVVKEIRNLRKDLVNQPKYIIRTIDDAEISKRNDIGKVSRGVF